MLGIVIAYNSESFFRLLIQDIFQWSTSGKIQFVGKNVFIFLDRFYFMTLGFAMLVLAYENLNQKIIQVFRNVIISFLIFCVVIFGFSFINAKMKIIECTACNDGIRYLHYNDINYGVILCVSSIIAIIPNLIRIITREYQNFIMKNEINTN